jgi:hypothetical protein
VKLAALAIVLVACDSGQPPTSTPPPTPTPPPAPTPSPKPSPPEPPATPLDDHLLAFPPLATPFGDIGVGPVRKRFERAFRAAASKRYKVVSVPACEIPTTNDGHPMQSDACIEAAREAGAARVVYGVIINWSESGRIEVELEGVALPDMVTHWNVDNILDSDEFFAREAEDAFARLVL